MGMKVCVLFNGKKHEVERASTERLARVLFFHSTFKHSLFSVRCIFVHYFVFLAFVFVTCRGWHVSLFILALDSACLVRVLGHLTFSVLYDTF